MRYSSLLMVCLSLIVVGSASARIPNNVTLTVLAPPKGTVGQGDTQVRAEAVVHRINTSEQLKEVALELLNHLKSSYPNGRSYSIALSNDLRMVKIGNLLAVATFKEGKSTVTGGVPMNMDIRVMKASHLEVRAPDELGMQVAYEVALLKRGNLSPNDKVYARIAKKHKLKVLEVKQLDRGITQYYKAFEGKPF